MKFILLAFILGSIICQEVDLNKDIPTYSALRDKYGNHTINRPLFHYTPDYGWMNDPNGCWYDAKNKVYHLYFQYYPADTIWTMPLYWGHATSKNLMLWKQQDIAIQPIDGASGAYSGSIFIDDDENFKVFFKDGDNARDGMTGQNNVIAAWTYTDVGEKNTWFEYQYLSYSWDDGYTFRTPNGTSLAGFENPVAQLGKDTKEYRDPQVIKVAKNTYIMSVAKSHEYQIYFFKSENQAKFEKWGEFGLIGYLGYQYECPNLVHLTCDDCSNDETIYKKDSYWVLFISINPGSIQGGSSTQYFIGTFNYQDSSKPAFEVDNSRTTVIDYGKDFYAMQLFFQSPTMNENDVAEPYKTAIGVGWASNWQYTALVPTDPWRSSMSIPREIKLKFYQPAGADMWDPSPKLLYIAQRPLLDDVIFDDSYKVLSTFNYTDSDGERKEVNPNQGEGYEPISETLYYADFVNGTFGALEFNLEYGIIDGYTNDNPGVLTIYLNASSYSGEYLRIGHNNKADAFFIDRGHTHVQWCHDNPFFTDKVSVTIYKKEVKSGFSMFSVHGIIDRNIIELFFNEDSDGFSINTSTNTFFFTGGNFIDSISFKVNALSPGNDKGYIITKFNARQLVLKSGVSDETEISETTTGRILKESDL